MLVPKLAITVAAGIALGLVASWPAALFSVTVVATGLTLSQLRREVEEVRKSAE
jgi:hypothetical protein